MKEYLGDAVYVDYDGYHIVLTTEDGVRVLNEIYLEPAVYDALVYYVHKMALMKGRATKEIGDTP